MFKTPDIVIETNANNSGSGRISTGRVLSGGIPISQGRSITRIIEVRGSSVILELENLGQMAFLDIVSLPQEQTSNRAAQPDEHRIDSEPFIKFVPPPKEETVMREGKLITEITNQKEMYRVPGKSRITVTMSFQDGTAVMEGTIEPLTHANQFEPTLVREEYNQSHKEKIDALSRAVNDALTISGSIILSGFVEDAVRPVLKKAQQEFAKNKQLNPDTLSEVKVLHTQLRNRMETASTSASSSFVSYQTVTQANAHELLEPKVTTVGNHTMFGVFSNMAVGDGETIEILGDIEAVAFSRPCAATSKLVRVGTGPKTWPQKKSIKETIEYREKIKDLLSHEAVQVFWNENANEKEKFDQAYAAAETSIEFYNKKTARLSKDEENNLENILMDLRNYVHDFEGMIESFDKKAKSGIRLQ